MLFYLVLYIKIHKNGNYSTVQGQTYYQRRHDGDDEELIKRVMVVHKEKLICNILAQIIGFCRLYLIRNQ